MAGAETQQNVQQQQQQSEATGTNTSTGVPAQDLRQSAAAENKPAPKVPEDPKLEMFKGLDPKDQAERLDKMNGPDCVRYYNALTKEQQKNLPSSTRAHVLDQMDAPAPAPQPAPGGAPAIQPMPSAATQPEGGAPAPVSPSYVNPIYTPDGSTPAPQAVKPPATIEEMRAQQDKDYVAFLNAQNDKIAAQSKTVLDAAKADYDRFFKGYVGPDGKPVPGIEAKLRDARDRRDKTLSRQLEQELRQFNKDMKQRVGAENPYGTNERRAAEIEENVFQKTAQAMGPQLNQEEKEFLTKQAAARKEAFPYAKGAEAVDPTQAERAQAEEEKKHPKRPAPEPKDKVIETGKDIGKTIGREAEDRAKDIIGGFLRR